MSLRMTKASFSQAPPFTYQEPFMRNLECDFSPHLVKDFHPFWGPFWFNIPSALPFPVMPDIYASNPWFGNLDPSPSGGMPFAVGIDEHHPPTPFAADNWYLYNNTLPAPPPTTHPVPFFASAVVDGHINPPGSTRTTLGTMPVLGPLPGFLVLPTSSPDTFVPSSISPCNTNDTYSIGPFGYGDVGAPCPDVVPVIPGTEGLGVRYNCQTEEIWPSNLQTFLAVIDPGQASAMAGGGISPSAMLKVPGRQELLEAHRKPVLEGGGR